MAKKPTPRQPPALDTESHRRLLKALNQARRPEDLAVLRRAGADDQQLASLLDARDAARPLGFAHLDEIRELLQIDPSLLRRWLSLFGPATYGSWAMPYETELPGGTPYHVAHAAVLKTGWVLFLPEASTKTTMLWDPSKKTPYSASVVTSSWTPTSPSWLRNAPTSS